MSDGFLQIVFTLIVKLPIVRSVIANQKVYWLGFENVYIVILHTYIFIWCINLVHGTWKTCSCIFAFEFEYSFILLGKEIV